MPLLETHQLGGVTLLLDEGVESGVTFAFTERGGGVSKSPFASLNLGARCGDEPSAVAENRRRVLAALGAEDLKDALVCPRQVHGTTVLCVRPGDEASSVAKAAEAGVDAVVCTAADVPVLMCFADCVPVVLVAPGGFAVAHSGWRGTIARVAACALETLVAETHTSPSEVLAYVGPHIGQSDYEVSSDLACRFAAEFGGDVVDDGSHLDLAACVVAALVEGGMPRECICVYEGSTASETDRFFSYRAEGDPCGRHGAIAFMRGEGL